MIDKEEMLEFANRVTSYFGFTLRIETNVNNKTKRQYFISGKPNKRPYFIYLFIVLLYSIATFFASAAMHDTDIDIILVVISLLIPIIIAISILIKSNKYYKNVEPKPTNIDIYKRDLPSNLRPAHVRMLLNDGKIDEKTIAATLLDLIDKGFIEISKTGERANIFSNEEIVLTKNNKEDSELFRYEKFLLEWFFDIYGDGKNVSNLQIKKALRDTTSEISPSVYFEYFQALVTISFPLDRYYKKNKISKKKTFISLIILILSIFGIMFFVGGICLAYGLGTSMFTMPAYVLNAKGTDEKDNWKDLKRYLLDFSNIKEKSSEMVKLWQFYLTYSVALNIYSIASSEIESFFGNEIYNNVNNSTDIISIPCDSDESLKLDISTELNKYTKILN